ncbi:hypothetical protein MtrunA17_Chr7g0241511 [Medicago truncatula]|uniref:DUF674 family protein n=1 Tax=Medicago truncatula TaxID=3880 RepID=A0A396H1L9_MEDTR|nr:hypothetical protein MtrunA17_Chr7g0241511 [Medicago truncatula]
MNLVMFPPKEFLSLGNGFAKETATFIISDDLTVMPNVFGTVIPLLQKLEITNIGAIVIDILKMPLVSKTPLTDFIFKKKRFCDEFVKINQPEYKNGEVTSKEGRQMSVKVLQRKSTGEILFVEGGVDFIDFIFSFLTFPLGGVLHMLQGFSSLSCIDNLYKSVTELSPDTYLTSQELKDKLTKPPIAAQFELSNPTSPISADTLPVYYYHTYYNSQWIRSLRITYYCCVSDDRCVLLNFVDPKYSASKSSSCGEFAKGPSVYMVTDDLVVTPTSSFNAISHLKSLNVPLSDVEEKVVRIGVNEVIHNLRLFALLLQLIFISIHYYNALFVYMLQGLSILKASLTSTSALTNGLNSQPILNNNH